jgi:hypothetical protein
VPLERGAAGKGRDGDAVLIGEGDDEGDVGCGFGVDDDLGLGGGYWSAM